MSTGQALPVTACRGCGQGDLTRVLDLGQQSACDHFPPADLPGPDPRWPLALTMCRGCSLVQLDHFSPVAEEPLAVESATLRRHALDATSRLLGRLDATLPLRVREFASQHGGSWSAALADAGCVLALDHANLVVDNQSIIHAENLEAELATRVAAMADDGVLAIEFHHALRQLEEAQFDTVRHGHPLYFSLHSWSAACQRHGLSVVDAWSEDVFGGCLVVLARRGNHRGSSAVDAILQEERDAKATSPDGYAQLAARMSQTVADLRAYLDRAQASGRTVAAYGAGSKAVTFLGVVGVHERDIPIVADLAPGKQGRRIPGTDIRIVSPDDLVASRPDDVVVLTWDIATEVVAQLRAAGLDARYLVPMPAFHELPS